MSGPGKVRFCGSYNALGCIYFAICTTVFTILFIKVLRNITKIALRVIYCSDNFKGKEWPVDTLSNSNILFLFIHISVHDVFCSGNGKGEP